MGIACTPCALTTAMAKAVKLSDKSDDIIDQAVSAFVDGHKTFKETCLELGLDEKNMEGILDKYYWDSTMK